MNSIRPIQRARIYKESKTLIISKDKRFICTAIRAVLIRRFGCHIKVQDVELYFTELSRRLPVGDKSRTHILTECEKEAEYATH